MLHSPALSHQLAGACSAARLYVASAGQRTHVSVTRRTSHGGRSTLALGCSYGRGFRSATRLIPESRTRLTRCWSRTPSLGTGAVPIRHYTDGPPGSIEGVADLLNHLPNISLDLSRSNHTAVTVTDTQHGPRKSLKALIDILPRLARLETSNGEPLYIFLVTPAFAADLVAKDDLIGSALERIIGNDGDSLVQVHTLVAVVDKLPRPSNPREDTTSSDTGVEHSRVSSCGHEGLSVTLSSSQNVSTGSGTVHNWSTESSRFTHSLEPEKPATLTFSFEPGHDEVLNEVLRTSTQNGPFARSYSIQVSLSSTIFQNGLKNTLINSTYKRSTHSGRFEAVARQEIQHAKIALPFSPGTGSKPSAALDLPLYRMTVGTTVDSCMGNIIRTVRSLSKGTVGAVSPASENLEEAVANYFKYTGVAPHALSVWALVVPSALAESMLPELQFDESKQSLSKFWSFPKAPFMGQPNLRVLTDLIARGAKICRVTSGGGGWGNKAGLLSLDPDTSFEAPVASFVDSIVGSFAGDSSPSDGLPEIASSGDVIQFYFLPPELLEQQGHQNADAQHENTRDKTSIQFGVVPDTTDMAGEVNSATTPTTGGETLMLYVNHFGALSEKGMSITTKDLKLHDGKVISTRNQSKIDVPFSRFSISSTSKGSVM